MSRTRDARERRLALLAYTGFLFKQFPHREEARLVMAEDMKAIGAAWEEAVARNGDPVPPPARELS